MSTASINNHQQSHFPVLYNETIQALKPKNPGRYIDATVGAGGHAWGILEASSPDGLLLGLDVDPLALELSKQRLSNFSDRVILVEASYTSIPETIKHLGWENVQGVLFDLGVSSMQLDIPERGFSFQNVGPLDMRFNPDQPTKADDLINQLPEEQLADLLWRYGEEPKSRQIARAICRSRPVKTTLELAGVIEQAFRGQRGRIHPATRSFQALRIAVNNELQNLETALPLAVSALAPGGRLVVISFHSLEDRMVKHFLRRESRDCICPPDQPICTCHHRASIKELSHHPIKANQQEILANPRSRSARLRYAEKRDLA